VPELLYVDTSAFLRRMFGADGADAVDRAVVNRRRRGGTVVSSRLLWLEARRVGTREALLGNDVTDVITANLAGVARLPMTEEVWSGAEAIAQHIKTLDSLHLATCELVGADLMTFDEAMRNVATARGIRLVEM
jgi:predicted nucleic acid-binding protein